MIRWLNKLGLTVIELAAGPMPGVSADAGDETVLVKPAAVTPTPEADVDVPVTPVKDDEYDPTAPAPAEAKKTEKPKEPDTTHLIPKDRLDEVIYQRNEARSRVEESNKRIEALTKDLESLNNKVAELSNKGKDSGFNFDEPLYPNDPEKQRAFEYHIKGPMIRLQNQLMNEIQQAKNEAKTAQTELKKMQNQAVIDDGYKQLDTAIDKLQKEFPNLHRKYVRNEYLLNKDADLRALAKESHEEELKIATSYLESKRKMAKQPAASPGGTGASVEYKRAPKGTSFEQRMLRAEEASMALARNAYEGK